MEYNIQLDIDGGLSHGFGLKEPHHEKINVPLKAPDDFSAVVRASGVARGKAIYSLSNPNTDLTIVKILSISDETGRVLNQRNVLKSKGYNNIADCYWRGKPSILVTECSMAEHLLINQAEYELARISASESLANNKYDRYTKKLLGRLHNGLLSVINNK